MKPSRRSPHEKIPGLRGATAGDFWAWAYSDILGNTDRGIFAEFLVGSALGVVEEAGPSGWGDFDLTYGEWKIEVKSSSYLQSWHQTDLSAIRFGIPEREGWDPETNTWRTEWMRSADCCVFCLYAEQDRSRVNVLDTSMWRFYVVPTERINRELGAQKNAALSTIERLAKPVGYAQLKERIYEVLSGVGSRGPSAGAGEPGVPASDSPKAQDRAVGQSSIQEIHDVQYQDAQDDYFQWLRDNPRGFVLNFKTQSWAVLHESGCMHIIDYSDPDVSLTFKRKVCAPSAAPLQAWAEEQGIRWDYCGACRR